MMKGASGFHYLLTIVVIACGSIPKGRIDPLPLINNDIKADILFSFLQGYDEGGFAGAKSLKSFLTDFGLTDEQWTGGANALADRKANISSFGVLGAAIGSIFALALTDRFGRLRTWQFFSLLWMTGIFMTVFSSGILGLILFARIWSGLGAGGLTVVAPLYLSEIAPAKSRGMVVSIYMVVLLTMLMLGKSITAIVVTCR
jgi:MFS family permease